MVVSELAGCDYCAGVCGILRKIAGLSPKAPMLICARNAGGDKRDGIGRFVLTIQQTRATTPPVEFATIKTAANPDVNRMFGGILKVTPTQKTVGDVELIAVTNNLNTAYVCDPEKQIACAEPVVSMLKVSLVFPPDALPKSHRVMFAG